MKINLILVSLLILISSCSKTDRIVISGELANTLSGDMSYLEELRVTGSRLIDSVKLTRNGKFKYSLKTDKIMFYELSFTNSEAMTLICFPGEKVEITADYEEFSKTKNISGSPATQQVNMLLDSLSNTVQKLNTIRDQYASLPDTILDLTDQQKLLNQQFAGVKKRHHDFSVKFILDDLSSLANIAALYQEYAPNEFVFNSQRDLQYFKLVSDTLQKYYPKLRHVNTLKEQYTSLISEYNARRLLSSTDAVSYDVPDLNLPSVSGKKISLSSLKGNLILLTFWSVNQQESLSNTLALKDIYSKYKPHGFEIYQVSIDKSIEQFTSRVKFEELEWISVIDTAFPQSSTRSLYNVTSIPQNYLINQNHTEILAKNLSPEALDQNIQNLLLQKN